jgi:serine/threonine protein kinase
MGQTDARTDIYCLGATLYHLVTGMNPCEPPYEIKPIREINPGLSAGLERIILKCTQRDPNDRYQSAAELMYALEHYKEDRGDEHLNFNQEVIEQLFNHYHSRWHRNRSRKFFGLGDTAEWQSRVEKNMKKAKKIVEEQDKENAEDED